MTLETLAAQLHGEVWHTGGGIMCVRVTRGHWTLTIGLAQPENGFLEADNDGWDFDFDGEYVDSKSFDDQIDFDGSNYAEVIEAEFVQLNDPISRMAMGF